MREPIYYRNYKIKQTDNGWSFIHENYDGAPDELYGPPADDRHGWNQDLVSALAEIDELEDAFSKADEQNFADIFGGYDDNEQRARDYARKRGYSMESRGPWVLEYQVRGQDLFTSGSTPQDAIRRTNEKHPEGWKFNDILTETEWFERAKA